MTEAQIATFTAAYIETALWSSTDESRDDGGDPLDSNYGPDDIAAETLEAMHADCRAFLADCGHLIDAAIRCDAVRCGPDFDAWGHAGHDFWLTRNHHGAGFWDGDWPEHGDVLTERANRFGEVDLLVGDDGQIHAF